MSKLLRAGELSDKRDPTNADSRDTRRTIARLGAWLLPSDARFDVLRIVCLNTPVALFFLYLGCFFVQPGSSDYETWADALVSGQRIAGNQALAWRDIGFPLILVASGFPWTHSFLGLAIIATCMGIAMPVLIYFSLRPWFPRTAYWTAMASIISLAPILFIKSVHHDQFYIFFMLVAVWSFSRLQAAWWPGHLYGLAFSVFAMSLIRLVGQGMYPPLLLLAWVQTRMRLRHVLASALLFAALTSAYSSYRAHVLGTTEAMLGHQVFQNMYLHLRELDGPLSPATGPNTARLIGQVHDLLLPSPAQSEAVTAFAVAWNPEFVREHFTGFTADELVGRFFTEPNWEYFQFMAERADDRLLLMASYEIALRHPIYVMRYTLLNAFWLLYDPGHASIRFAIDPFARERLNFPLSGPLGGYGYNVYDRAPEPALSEAGFLPLLRQGGFIRDLYFAVDSRWRHLFHPLYKIMFGLMLVTWISTAIGVAGKVVRAPGIAWWSKLWLSDHVVAATSGISLLLLLNVGLTALLVDQLYRYAESILLLQIMLAMVGGAVLIRLVQNFVPIFTPAGVPAAAVRPWLWRHVAISAIVLVAAAVGFAAWAWNVRSVATSIPAEGTIHITDAGGNCSDGRRDTWQQINSSCSGLKECDYLFDRRALRDPGPSCRENFHVEWTCTAGGPALARTWAPIPLHNTPLRIACP